MQLIKDTWLNVFHYFRTLMSSSKKQKTATPAYINEDALDHLVNTFPDECRLWLEAVYSKRSAIR
jgi:hypothetical protein